MSKRTLHPLPLTLSIVAILFSAYATFAAGGFDFLRPNPDDFKSSVTLDEEKKKEMYAYIEQYVADQNAEYQKKTQEQQRAQAEAQLNQEPVEVSLDDDPMHGEVDAPVTMVEFSDYECPYCGRFFAETYPQIKAKYIDTGKVKHVFRDFPLPFHEDAIPAANAAECIRDQGGDEMYFAYHDALFENQNALSVSTYKTLAADFDINQSDFANCVDELRFEDEINADIEEGVSYGVQGTPAFFINGIFINGAQPYATFEAAIEKALNE